MAGPFSIETAYPAPTDVQSQFPSHEEAFRTTVWNWLSYISSATDGTLNIDAIPPEVDHFDGGTVTVFNQAAAPTGWTADDSTYLGKNAALRIVDPTEWVADVGGSKAFETVFTSQTPAGTLDSATPVITVAGHALTAAELATHAHGVNINSGTVSADHTHNFSGTTSGDSPDHSHGFTISDAASGASTYVAGRGPNASATQSTGGASTRHTHTYSGTTSGISANHYHNVNGNTGNAGSGNAHTHTATQAAHSHTFTGTAISFDVYNAMFLQCTKDDS